MRDSVHDNAQNKSSSILKPAPRFYFRGNMGPCYRGSFCKTYSVSI